MKLCPGGGWNMYLLLARGWKGWGLSSTTLQPFYSCTALPYHCTYSRQVVTSISQETSDKRQTGDSSRWSVFNKHRFCGKVTIQGVGWVRGMTELEGCWVGEVLACWAVCGILFSWDWCWYCQEWMSLLFLRVRASIFFSPSFVVVHEWMELWLDAH